MTIQPSGRLGGCRFAILRDPDTREELKYLCLECEMETPPDRDSFLDARKRLCTKAQGKGKRPPPPLPDGYEIDGAGGYYTVTAPDGEVVEGPSNGKWHGEEAAIRAAHEHNLIEE